MLCTVGVSPSGKARDSESLIGGSNPSTPANQVKTMSLQNTLILLLAFETGFVLQILKTLGGTINRQDSPLRKGIKRSLVAAVIAGLLTLLSSILNPSGFTSELFFYCILVPAVVFTTVLGFYLGFSYQTKLAPRVSRRFVITSFLVCTYLFLTYGPNDILSHYNMIGAQFEYTVVILLGVTLFLLPLYIKKKFSLNLKIFYYTSVLLLLGLFAWSQFSLEFLKGSDFETYRLILILKTLVSGTLYAYLTLQAYFLIQIFELCVQLFWYQKVIEPLLGEMQLRQGEAARYENLKKLLSRNFLNDDSSPGVLFLQTIALAILLVLNFIYSWVDSYLLAALIIFVLPLLAPLKIDNVKGY